MRRHSGTPDEQAKQMAAEWRGKLDVAGAFVDLPVKGADE